MKYSLINEYEKCLRESVKKKQIEESTMQVYLAGVDRILRAVISVLPKKNIGAIIKKVDPKISKDYYKLLLRVVTDLQNIVEIHKR